METLSQDLRYGGMLLKRPGFTMIAVFTLALGIGVNTALFTVFNVFVLQLTWKAESKQRLAGLQLEPTREAAIIAAGDEGGPADCFTR